MKKLSLLLMILTFAPISYITAGIRNPVRAVGIGFGWYKPSLDYWNEKTEVADWDTKFDGELCGQLNINFRIVSKIAAKLEVGYWKEMVSQDNIPIGLDLGREEISLRLLPVTGTVLYYLPIYKFGATPYLGVGGGSYFVEKEITYSPDGKTSTSDTDRGFGYAGHFAAGIEWTILSRLTVVSEFRYVVGKYIQQVQDIDGNVFDEDVSISGPQIRLSLNFQLRR